MGSAARSRSSIHPSLHHCDALPAICEAPATAGWLCWVRGFEKRAVHQGSEGGIAHAQRTFGRIFWIGDYDPWA